MSRAIKRRLNALEAKSEAEDRASRQVTVEDIIKNLDKKIADESSKADASGEHLMARVNVPHKGESTNEFRKANGLTALDIDGWDDPRA